ncbi:AAA family ATPase [Streptomyces sp. NPDC057877]|uniref:AAA family ATPase n=1 Tax=Streptomyces sp. NPDC057877 TaxID=3346269 RepID=UPI00368D2ADC
MNAYDVLDDGPEIPDDIANLIAETADDMPEQPKAGGLTERFPSVDWDNAWSQDFSRIDWLPGKLMERGQQVALVGAGKVGKSIAVLDWCWHCVTGRRFLGDDEREPLRVLYFDRENNLRDVITRLKAFGAKPDELRDRFVYKLFPRFTGGLDDSQTAEAELMALVDEAKPDIVILDTVSRFIGGKENDADTWLSLYRRVHAPLKDMDIAGVRLDHFGKDYDRGSRGSSAKTQDVDHVWEMKLVSEHVARDDAYGLETHATEIKLARTHTRTGLGQDSVMITRRGVKQPDGIWTEGGTRHLLSDPGALADAEKTVNHFVAQLSALGAPTGYGRDKLKQWAKEHGVKLPGNTTVLGQIVSKYKRLHTPGMLPD